MIFLKELLFESKGVSIDNNKIYIWKFTISCSLFATVHLKGLRGLSVVRGHYFHDISLGLPLLLFALKKILPDLVCYPLKVRLHLSQLNVLSQQSGVAYHKCYCKFKLKC